MQVRFRIRDLLWLAAVVALAVGWWIDHRRVVRDAAIKDDLAPVKIRMLEGNVANAGYPALAVANFEART